MKSRSSLGARTTIVAALTVGGTSLVGLGFFLLIGPLNLVDLNLSTVGSLVFDGCLCLAFVFQHSGTVRKSVQDQWAKFVPRHFNGAIYGIASGVVLWALLLLWQPTAVALVSVGELGKWVLRFLSVAAVLGFVWGVRSLGSFDAFGIKPIRANLAGRILKDQPLTIRGPYKWVRHPLYTCMLVLMWCYPDLTADRLVLNTVWTLWIFVGTILEERDLVSVFGNQYREYQTKVPMLIPWRVDRNVESWRK